MEQDRINNLQEIEEIKKKYNEEIEEKGLCAVIP